MALKTLPVHLNLKNAQGAVLSSATVSCKLTAYEVDAEFIVPKVITGTTDSNGDLTLNLWPTARGRNSSRYQVVAVDSSGEKVLDVYISVPDATAGTTLEMTSLINQAPFPPVDEAQALLLQMQTLLAGGGGGGGAVSSVAGKTGVVTLAKADVGLGNVDNTSDVNKPVSTAQAAAIAAAIANLVNSSPAALDTLNELATALGNDANFSTTMTNALAGKQATLVSGTNIKTVGGQSILGSGDLSVGSSGNFGGYNNIRNRIARAFADARSGSTHRRMMVIGDSTSTGNSLGITKAWPTYLKSALQGKGYNVADGFMGSHNFALNTGTWAFDSRCTFSTVANISLIGTTFTGIRFTGTGNMTFTPVEQFTNIRFYVINNAGGTISYQIDGGAANNIVIASGLGYTAVDVTGVTLGTHTITVNWVSGTADLLGIEVWDTNANKMNIINLANNGQIQTSIINPSNGWAFDNLLAVYTPDVVLYELGTNDFPYSTTQFTSDLTSVINSCINRNVGLILGTFAPNNGWGDGNIANANAKRDIIRSLAKANNIPLIDVDKRWSSDYTTFNGLGYYVDAVHLTALGHAEKAAAWEQGLLALPNYQGY